MRAKHKKMMDNIMKSLANLIKLTTKNCHEQKTTCQYKPDSRYIACSNLDMTWDLDEIEQVIMMAQSGDCLGKISCVLKRREEEIEILLIDFKARMNSSEKLH